MAQWQGGYSGNTHETKVADVEQLLRHAITVHRTAASEDQERKAKSVKNLAKRVLAARVKLLKSRISALQPVVGHRQNADGIKSLREREARTVAAGVRGILIEFGAADIWRPERAQQVAPQL